MKELSPKMYELPFDAILFDVGGVLLTNGWDREERAAAVAHFGLDAQELDSRHLAAMEAWERGETDVNRYLDSAVFYEPRAFSRDEFLAFMFAQSQPLPNGALPVLAELAASNQCASNTCVLGALNNEARETNEYRFTHFGLRRYFRVAFSSCYVGLRKPDPAIYRRALDILGCAPERVLFIDDRVENVEGGLASGMHAIRFIGGDALRGELAKLGALQQATNSKTGSGH
jgi:putative hydrolase of the HAD superfamily